MRRICGEIYGHSSTLYARRLDIFERTAALGVPAIYQSPEFAEEGGLSGYGPRITQMFRQLARQLAKVLGGEKVSDVPVELSTGARLVPKRASICEGSMEKPEPVIFTMSPGRPNLGEI